MFKDDQRAEERVALLLRAGVLLSAAVVLFGGALYLFHYGKETPHYGIFRGETSDLTSVRGILRDALAFKRRGLIQFGLLLLIATPVVRVFFSIFLFARQRDYQYVLITLIVFALLMFSLFGMRLA